MKNKISNLIITLIVIIFSICLLTACDYRGYDVVDNNYHFDYAYISMPDGTLIEGEIKTWADAEGEQLTITMKDGKRYLVNSMNCVLVEWNE